MSLMGRFSHSPTLTLIRGTSLFNLPNRISFGVRKFFKDPTDLKIISLQVGWRRNRRQKNEICNTLKKCALGLN